MLMYNPENDPAVHHEVMKFILSLSARTECSIGVAQTERELWALLKHVLVSRQRWEGRAAAAVSEKGNA